MEKLEARIRKLNEERFEERQSAASKIEALEETLKQEKSQQDVELAQMEKDMIVALSAAKNYEQEQVNRTLIADRFYCSLQCKLQFDAK